MSALRSRSPISTEARAKLRRWKADLGRRLVEFERVLHRDATVKIATDLSLCGKVGRERALRTLKRLFAPYASLAYERLDQPPLAVWAVLKPRIAVLADDDPDDPGATQDCVCVDCVCAGQLVIRDAPLAGGLWTLEATDHALGRLFQRESACNPANVLLGAHGALLAARLEVLRIGEVVLAPAGPGVFACQAIGGQEVVTDEPSVHFRARTWLHQDQLTPEEEQRIIDPAPAGEITLARSWLIPAPLRLIEQDGDRLLVFPWGPGLPEMLVPAASTRLTTA